MLRALANPLVYLDYELRKEYISAYLCVNRDNPAMACHGKCHLVKELKEVQAQEEGSLPADGGAKARKIHIDPMPNELELPPVAVLLPAVALAPARPSAPSYSSPLAQGHDGQPLRPPIC